MGHTPQSTPTSPNKRKRRAGILIGFLVLSIALAGIVGELGARLLFAKSTPLFPRYHTGADYGEFRLRRIRPNSVFKHTSIDGKWRFKTNAQGFRNVEDFTYEKPSDVVRVLCLGDSQTQGYECDQESTYAAIIERRLERAGWNAQVINAGVSGFSTAECLLFLENEGIRYEPDFVVYGFFSNDPADNLKCGLFALENQELVIQKKAHLPGVSIQDVIYAFPPVRFLSENSYLYSKMFNTVWNFFKIRAVQKSRAASGVEYAVQTEAHSAVEIDLTNALIHRLGAYLDEKNIPLIILDLPAPILESEDQSEFQPSITPEFSDAAREAADLFLSSPSTLDGFRGLTAFHVAHGQRHMTPFSHLMFGEQAGTWILERLGPPPATAP